MFRWLVCYFLGHLWSKSFLSYKGHWFTARRCLRCKKSEATKE